MADRYQDRPFPADDHYGRGGDRRAQPATAEGDPLAELARLIGQTDPFAMGRANQPVLPRGGERDQSPPPSAASDDELPAGPPPWMRRATPQAAPQQDYQQEYPQEYPSAVHPLHRHAAQHAAPEPDYQELPAFTEAGQAPDPSRYDDALYGQVDPGAQPSQHDPAYADDAYAYQDGYDDQAEEPARKRGGMISVAVVLALAVVGTGAAFAYRTYVGSSRSGEPPIIKADNSPTKIVPAPSDGTAKVPDRMAIGDGAEKIVPREEAPVDVNARSGPRVVFPPLNPNGNPPPVASVAPVGTPAAGAGMPSNEPRKIRTLAVRGDQADGAAVPVTSPPPAVKPAPAPRAAATASPPAAPATRSPPSSANASANGPLSLAPQAAPLAPAARVAATNPAPAAPTGAGGYLVQVASQRSEADAQASFRALQGKYPAVLGSRSPLIKRADLGGRGVYYRAMIGPFGSADEATQLCGSLKTAGGQCVVQRN